MNGGDGRYIYIYLLLLVAIVVLVFVWHCVYHVCEIFEQNMCDPLIGLIHFPLHIMIKHTWTHV